MNRPLPVWPLALLLGGCSFYARSPEDYRNDTAALLSTRNADIAACYDSALKAQPGLTGKVTVHFTVELKTGKLKDVKADPTRTTAPQPLVDCVVNTLGQLTLNPPDQRTGDATFEYDFANAPPAAPHKG